jgi:hypothetical protein
MVTAPVPADKGAPRRRRSMCIVMMVGLRIRTITELGDTEPGRRTSMDIRMSIWNMPVSLSARESRAG